MKNAEKTTLLRELEKIEAHLDSSVDTPNKYLLMIPLAPLLEAQGYAISKADSADSTVDFYAYREGNEIEKPLSYGIIYKHYVHSFQHPRFKVGIIDTLNGMKDAARCGADRAILLSNSTFTPGARHYSKLTETPYIELLDIPELRSWIQRSEENGDRDSSEVKALLKSISSKFARLIAKDPRYLDHIEWRDLERVMAEVFEEIGFSVTLTPGSKDGGKDLILECIISGGKHIYLVEIKHWTCPTKVGGTVVKDFLHVIVKEKANGGLILSSGGYSSKAHESLSEIEHQHIMLGGRNKIVSLCQTYTKSTGGLWSPPNALPDVLFDAHGDYEHRPNQSLQPTSCAPFASSLRSSRG